MNKRILRALAVAIGLLSLAEVLLLHWAAMAFGRNGLDLPQSLLALAGVALFNVIAFPMARRRLHATGAVLLASRGWILASVAALVSGLMLAAVFAIVGGGSLVVASLGFSAPTQTALVWLGGLAVALGFGSILWGSSVGNYRVRIDQVELPLPHLSPPHRDLRIAHITDLHIGPLLGPKRLREFVARINRLEPDLVLITGDLFDFDPAFVEAGCLELATLHGRLGVFAVLGNHDVYTGAEAVAEGLEKFTSIRLLRDEWEHLEFDGVALILAGIEDPGEGWRERDSQSAALERIAGEIPDGILCLLLAHRPSFFAQAAGLGFPLMLSGHTHGGQVSFPGARHHNIGRMVSRWTRGLFQLDESLLYVNRGLGMAGLPLRLNCPREIAMLQLVDPPD